MHAAFSPSILHACLPACYSRHVLSSLLTRFFKCSSNVCRPPRAVLPIRLSLATPGPHVLKPSLSLQTEIGRERLPSSKSGGSRRIAERERDGRDEVGRVKLPPLSLPMSVRRTSEETGGVLPAPDGVVSRTVTWTMVLKVSYIIN